MTTRTARVKHAWLVAGGLVAAGVGAWLLLHEPQRPQSAAAGGSAPLDGLRTAQVQLKKVVDVYVADAQIEAVHSAVVSAETAGNITRFYVDAGERVGRGELLARIDARETDARHAAGERDPATARSFAELRSPISGVVTRRLAELGEPAVPGKPVVELHDPAALRAVASIPQSVLPRVRRARTAVVILATQNVPVRGTHVTVLPAADPELLPSTQSVQVRVDLPAGLAILPGTAAKVRLPAGATRRLVVPESALVRQGELNAVHVVDAEGRAALRQVRVGEAAGSGLVEVFGLDAGERVRIP